MSEPSEELPMVKISLATWTITGMITLILGAGPLAVSSDSDRLDLVRSEARFSPDVSFSYELLDWDFVSNPEKPVARLESRKFPGTNVKVNVRPATVSVNYQSSIDRTVEIYCEELGKFYRTFFSKTAEVKVWKSKKTACQISRRGSEDEFLLVLPGKEGQSVEKVVVFMLESKQKKDPVVSRSIASMVDSAVLN